MNRRLISALCLALVTLAASLGLNAAAAPAVTGRAGAGSLAAMTGAIAGGIVRGASTVEAQAIALAMQRPGR
jgi:hypothetical protein